MPAMPAQPAIGPVEFVALIAMLMAMSALGVDMMLPALPDIGQALQAPGAGQQQFIITLFGAGFGASQICHGPLIDRFGRRRVLLWALVAYALLNAVAALSMRFGFLLAIRFLSGSAVSGVRVAALAILRDCHAGQAMARMLSLAFMVFMIFPILAPAFGAGILLIGNWRSIFWCLAVLSLAIFGWVALRLPETLLPEHRRPIRMGAILRGWQATLGHRLSLGYTLATMCLTGAFYGYLGSIQPIMAQCFKRADLLLPVFATSAGVMMAANLLNARLVMRLGARRLSTAAIAIMTAAASLQLLLALQGLETLVLFTLLQALMLASFSLSSANFAAIAMEPMGAVAGTASGLQGFIALTFGAALGALVGHAFDGTIVPLASGFLLAALATLAITAMAGRKRPGPPADQRRLSR